MPVEQPKSGDPSWPLGQRAVVAKEANVITRHSVWLLLALLVVGIAAAQTYRCDWSVVGVAGGEMASSEYRCVATAGQTVAGFMASPDFWALIGYWLPEGQTGEWSSGPVVECSRLGSTLHSLLPSPARSPSAIRWTLNVRSP